MRQIFLLICIPSIKHAHKIFIPNTLNSNSFSPKVPTSVSIEAEIISSTKADQREERIFLTITIISSILRITISSSIITITFSFSYLFINMFLSRID